MRLQNNNHANFCRLEKLHLFVFCSCTDQIIVTIELTNSHEPSWGGVGSIFSYANIASDIIHFADNFDLESAKVHICISNQCS